MKNAQPMDRDAIEVELSAEELLDVPASSAAESAHCARKPVLVQLREEDLEDAVGAIEEAAPMPAKARARRFSASWMVLALGLPVAATAVIGVQYNTPAPQSTVQAVPAPAPVEVPVIAEPAAPVVEAPPVRFKNPFDASEVFEFPSGTTREEARAAVAEILLERAREREAMFAATRPARR